MSSLNPTSSTAARTIASLLSLAITDALGAPVEFCRRDTFPPITTFIPTRHFSLPAGTPTDDTSMALCLASSLLTSRTSSPTSQGTFYVRWFREGYLSATGSCFDIGNCTRSALVQWSAGEKEGMEVFKAEKGSQWERFKNQQGNGGLMRVLPVPLVAWRDPQRVRRWADESCRVTHPAFMNRIACEIYAVLVAGVLSGEFRDGASGKLEKRLLIEKLESWEGWEVDVDGNRREGEEREEVLKLKDAMTGVAELRRDEVSSSGYALHTIQAAVWAFLVSDSFVDGARLVVNLGDDADTVGAVYGGLAGAWYGGYEDGERKGWWEDEVVMDWRSKLGMREKIEEIAVELAKVDGKLWES